MNIKEFFSKKEASDYIVNMPIDKKNLLRPQVREEFTYKPYPHNRVVLIAFNSHKLLTDDTWGKSC